MKLTLSGITPSKKNSRINTRSGRSFPSKRFTDWEKTALNELKEQFSGLQVSGYPIPIKMIFFNSDRRRHDLDNQCSSILDTLVKAGVVEDDNQNFINKIILEYGGIDKDNPRCEIYLED